MVFGLISVLAFGAINLESEGDHYFLTIRMPSVVAHEVSGFLMFSFDIVK